MPIKTPTRGFSLLEVLLIVSIVGILLGVGFVNMPRERFAVQQAAQGLARDVQLARFEAISSSAFVGIHPQQARFTSGIYSGNGYLVFVDASSPPNYRYDVGETVLKTVNFAGESLAQLYDVSTTSTTTFDVVFDPRGISRGNAKIRLTSKDRKYERWVCVNLQGSARIKPNLASC